MAGTIVRTRRSDTPATAEIGIGPRFKSERRLQPGASATDRAGDDAGGRSGLGIDARDGTVGGGDDARRSARARRCERRRHPRRPREQRSSSARSRRASLSDSIHGGAAPAFRSIRWAIAHSPAAESSSSGSRSPWYGRSSKAPWSIASRIWRSTRLSQLWRGLRPALGVAALRTHGRIVPRRHDRRAVTVRCYGSDVQLASDGTLIVSATDLVGYPRLRPSRHARTRARPAPLGQARSAGTTRRSP